MAEVVTHARFQLDKLDRETLKSMGVEVLSDFPSDAELGLEEPKYGEQVLGTLSDEEYSIFVDMVETNEKLQHFTKAIAARKMREVADKMESEGDLLHAAANVIENIHKDMFDTSDEEKDFYKARSKFALMNATFYWVLSEKYDVHHLKTGVRSKRRFVSKGPRKPNG